MDRCTTMARFGVFFAAVPWLLSCGGNTGMRQGEHAQPVEPQGCSEPIVLPPSPGEPSAEPPSSPEPREWAALPRCSPVPPELWFYQQAACTRSETNTWCMEISTNVYLWDPSRDCKKEIHAAGSSVYECIDTGIPVTPDMSIAVTLDMSCHCRDRQDGWVEVVNMGTSSHDRHMRKAGWRSCGFDCSVKIYPMRDCD